VAYSFTHQKRNRSTGPTLPNVGPGIIAPKGIDGVLVLAGSSGPVVQFRWPDRYKLSRFIMTLESGDFVQLANTELLLEDETQHLITLDGQGLRDTVPGLAIGGFFTRWQAFDRIVQPGDQWTMQVVNGNLVDVTPRVYFGLEVLP
jgi:hypothetical protein